MANTAKTGLMVIAAVLEEARRVAGRAVQRLDDEAVLESTVRP